METTKKAGIWMDHSIANLIDLNDVKNNQAIQSKFTFEIEQEVLSRSEKTMHNKEQQMHEAYYKKIADEILNYDHIVLFGPTNAKTELHNYLQQDLHFKDIKIYIESTDKMTDNEKIAFVSKYFQD